MKFFYCLTFISCIFLTSCKKTSNEVPLASLNIIDASIGSPFLYIYLTTVDTAFYLQHLQISFGSSLECGVSSGNNPLMMVSSLDTNTSFLQGDVNLAPGGIYSFYLSGVFPNQDTLFLRDTIPTYADSLVGVRFINLSPNSTPMTVNLQGNYPNSNEFINLGYQEITPFKSYNATSSVQGVYNFEIRDQMTGNLLYTYSWNFTEFKSNTLVIDGSENASCLVPIGILSVNNF